MSIQSFLNNLKSALLLGIVLNIITLGIGAFDYFLWYDSPVILGNIAGIGI